MNVDKKSKEFDDTPFGALSTKNGWLVSLVRKKGSKRKDLTFFGEKDFTEENLVKMFRRAFGLMKQWEE